MKHYLEAEGLSGVKIKLAKGPEREMKDLMTQFSRAAGAMRLVALSVIEEEPEDTKRRCDMDGPITLSKELDVT